MVTTTRWNVMDHLDSEEAIAAYLEAAREGGDPELIKAAASDAKQARRILAGAERHQSS